MTTLRSFQAEIENFSHEKQKQAIERAREAHAAAELAKHHKKHVDAKAATAHHEIAPKSDAAAGAAADALDAQDEVAVRIEVCGDTLLLFCFST